MCPDWKNNKYFCKNKVVTRVEKVAEGLDNFLSVMGFEREGDFYRVRKSNDATIVIAGHGGSSSAVLAHLFHLTFPFVCATIRPECTGITIVNLSGEEGALAMPKFEILNDARHIAGICEENVFDN